MTFGRVIRGENCRPHSPRKNFFDNNTAMFMGFLRRARRPLTCCSSKDFQHEVVAPPATAAFHSYTFAARMLLQQ